MTLPRALVVVAVGVVALSVGHGPAGARCVGPTIEHDAGTVDRDGTVHVVGTYWGDDCHDTGSPPRGESVIGKPVTDIEIFLVQGGLEHLVATGDADEGYGFVVDVPVPDELEPGPIEVVARTDRNPLSGDVTTEALVVVSERPPAGAGDDAPVRLEEHPGPGFVPAATDDDNERTTSALVIAIGGVLLVAGLVAAAVFVIRGRRRR